MNAGITLTEATQRLIYPEEMAIEQQFGIDPYTGGEHKPMTMLRAMVFVQLMRNGKTKQDAAKAAKDMSMRDVTTFFDDEPVDEGKELTPSQ